MGFFNPALSDQALACIDMMDFDGKDRVAENIRQNGTMQETVMALKRQVEKMAAVIDAQNGTNLRGLGVRGAQPDRAQAPARQSGAEKQAEDGPAAARRRAKEAAQPYD